MKAEHLPTADEAEVLAGIRDMYDAFASDDRERFDSHLDSRTTTWESELPRIYTRAELDEFRDQRNSSAVAQPVVSHIRVDPRRVDVWGDTAIAVYLLTVATVVDAQVDATRVTDVLRRADDGWRIVHHHAQHRDEDDTQ
jgi:5-enolpyruvylshikimate-3-phosphate synthase